MNFIRRLKPSIVISYVVAIALGVIASFLIFNTMQPDPWRPLGPYPEQRVVSNGDDYVISKSENNAKIPAIKISDETITVTASKCAKEDVKITSKYGWRSKNPVGFVYKVPEGPPGQRIKGCQSFTADIPIPDEAREWALEKIKDDIQPELYLAGCEIPLAVDGHAGERLCWQTETFAFVK